MRGIVAWLQGKEKPLADSNQPVLVGKMWKMIIFLLNQNNADNQNTNLYCLHSPQKNQNGR